MGGLVKYFIVSWTGLLMLLIPLFFRLWQFRSCPFSCFDLKKHELRDYLEKSWPNWKIEDFHLVLNPLQILISSKGWERLNVTAHSLSILVRRTKRVLQSKTKRLPVSTGRPFLTIFFCHTVKKKSKNQKKNPSSHFTLRLFAPSTLLWPIYLIWLSKTKIIFEMCFQLQLQSFNSLEQFYTLLHRASAGL